MASSPPLPPPTKLGSRVGLVAMPVGRRPRSPWPFSSLTSSPPSVRRPFATTCFATPSASTAAPLTASVGSPPPAAQLQWSLDGRHVLVLNVVACAVRLSRNQFRFRSNLCVLAVFIGNSDPFDVEQKAFGTAANSIERLLDVTREELPDTMAAVRLSGMEISDLTMELSELGRGIGQGVRSSSRAVRIAEDRLRRLTTMTPTVPMRLLSRTQESKGGPVIANAARSLRQGIARGRAISGALLTITQLSRWAFNFFASQRKKRLP
ncbi:hypothetical protein Taro_024108 [Colocasia esculenta]|uniref:Uncharacterized protein n=1 Tax=Colocasia esculenta TaxID=4460 RepID=A0A843VJD8_COLES|nr:hypothetical protein [Colocasia esculenta]